MSSLIKLNQKMILKNAAGKIIEIENRAESNHISSIGKFGPLPSFKKFSSSELALEKANQLIEKKIKNGYQSQAEESKGEYLEKGTDYW